MQRARCEADAAMRIVEFTEGTLRFLDSAPARAPASGFIWIHLDRDSLPQRMGELQDIAQRLGGSALLDLHLKDLGNADHPSNYDYTSIYDLVVFRRLASPAEVDAELDAPSHGQHSPPLKNQLV